MAKIKKNDFIEINYVGRVKDSNAIFDLTDEELAKKSNIYQKGFPYGPLIICVGHNYLLKGLDEALEGKEINKPYEINLEPEKAFGKRNNRFLKVINSTVLKKQKIDPFPGLKVNIDNSIGTVRSISGGRTIIDFNHPLAGKEVYYEFTINRVVDDVNEKINSVFKFVFPFFKIDYEIIDGILKIKNDIKSPIREEIVKKIKELVQDIRKVLFIFKEDK